MLNALEIENFKAFGARTRVEFAPITLIFGENSAGKSSLLHALNLLKQTRESRDTDAVLLPRAERGLIDLGSFHELLFDHDAERSLTFRLDIDGPRCADDVDHIAKLQDGGGHVDIGFEFSARRETSNNEVRLEQISVYLGQSRHPLTRFEPSTLTQEELRRLRPLPYSFAGFRGPIRQSGTRVARCVMVSESPELWKEAYNECRSSREAIVDALNALQGEVLGQRSPPSQLSLFREEQQARTSLDKAKEFYSREFSLTEFIERATAAQRQSYVPLEGFLPVSSRFDRSLEMPELLAVRLFARFARTRDLFQPDACQLLIQAGQEVEEVLASLFPLGPYRRPPERLYIFTGTTPQDVGYSGDLLPDLLFRNPRLVDNTNEWLHRLELGYQIDIRPVGTRSNDLFEVRLVDTRRKTHVDVGLTDVGFGISQLLPLIVQSLASSDQIITVEQPEVHIHPRLQADLGDLLAAAIQVPRNHRFIVETHSEHLVLRMQKLVREGTLSPSDVSILYVSRGESGSQVATLRLDEEGDFVDDWPGGFFPERLRELR